MNQIFSRTELFKLVKHNEFDEYGYTEDDLLEEFDEIFTQINNRTFEFDINNVLDYYITDKLSHKIVLRKLNDNIKRLYKDEQSNRRVIISQIKTLLEETCPAWILRTDIRKFYESIERDRIISRLKDDAMLSFQSIYLIEKLFSNSLLNEDNGLPRGISISSTLSELYMRKFDKWIRRLEGVYYYARFVDDIIIFSHSPEVIENIKKQINNKLNELANGLEINESKTESFSGNHIRIDKSLDYLGYKFFKKSQRKDEKLNVSISDKKVKKIKTKIIKSLVDYNKNLDFRLLQMRIKFLTGNYSIRKRVNENDLRAGIFYNYSEINDTNVLKELNIFMNKAIYSKNGSFGSKLSRNLTKDQKVKLSTYSFRYGFLNRVYSSFTFDEMKAIISCW